MQEAHIPIERMQEVVREYDAAFTPAEEEHIQNCPECLAIFTQLVLGE
jgi:predicted anti-sigma-YlaC factor YlaD